MRNIAFRVLIGVLGALLVSSSASAVCTDYIQHIHWIGSNTTIGFGPYENDITISGTKAYVGRHPGNAPTLQVVDISTPASPALLGSVSLNYAATGGLAHITGITVVGSTAYVADAYAGMVIVNISNPASPTVLGRVDTPGVAEDVAVAGTLAYVADYSAGLQVVNISNPAAPSIIGTVDTPGNAFGVALNGSIAYVADEFAGLQVVNVSNPNAPAIVGTIGNPSTPDGPGNAQDLVAVGSTLYVADGKSGLVVIDASTPQSPVILGSANTPGYAWDVRIQGTHAFIADDTKGFAVVDITNSSSPNFLGTKESPSSTSAIGISGSAGFVIDRTFGLYTFDASAIAPLLTLGSLEAISDYGASTMIGATGSLVCVPNRQTIIIIDSSKPLAPKIVNAGSLLLPGTCGGVALSGTTAYVACGSLLVFDLSNPSNPQELGRIDGIEADDIVISGTRAFVVDNVGSISQRLLVIDIVDPQHPSILGTLNTIGRHPTVSGTLVYLGHGSDIDVVDVSNPAQPVLIGGIQLSGWRTGSSSLTPRNWMAISGNYGFVPVFQTDSNGYLLASGVAKLELNPSPESPRLIGITSTPGGTGGVAASGSTIFVGAGDVQNGPLIQNGPVRGGGIYVFDATDMSIIGSADVQAANIVAAGGLVYAVAWKGFGNSSLYILPDHCEGTPIAVAPDPGLQGDAGLGAAFPNPGRSGSSFIPFTVSKVGMVRLRIIDTSGREVRTLVNGTMDAGERRVEWDGRNAVGDLAPAGIYFYELDAPGIKAARKLVRLR